MILHLAQKAYNVERTWMEKKPTRLGERQTPAPDYSSLAWFKEMWLAGRRRGQHSRQILGLSAIKAYHDTSSAAPGPMYGVYQILLTRLLATGIGAHYCTNIFQFILSKVVRTST